MVLKGLKTLEYRGYDSWGITAIAGNGHMATKKRTGKIGAASTAGLAADSSLAFGHTRWATHGGVTEANAHPHSACNDTLAVIHNGIIENYAALKHPLTARHAFLSETDSEVAAHYIEELCTSLPFSEAVRTAFRAFEGSNALIALDPKRNMLVAARNGSPLVLGFGTDGNYVASDPVALMPYTKNIYFLDDNEMAVITADSIVVRDIQSGTVKKVAPVKLDWKTKTATKGRYATFMEKEMREQPDIFDRIASKPDPALALLADAVAASRGSYLVGCGSAAYACMCGSYLFSAVAKRHMNWAIGSEFGFQLEFLNDKSLVIALSQSGETMDTLEAVKKARAKGATIASLTNVPGSTLGRLSSIVIPLDVGPEIGVASTKAMTAKVAYLLTIAHVLAGKRAEGKRLLHAAAAATRTVFRAEWDHIRALAKTVRHAGSLFVIGRGLSFPTALETALKIKEISYIHAEGLAAGELKHGPIALIEKGTPCIAFLPDDETYGANLAGAMEMKARGGRIIGISHRPHDVFDDYVHVPDAGIASVLPDIIAGQMLGYTLAREKGLDADKPRNLAKSVTVK